MILHHHTLARMLPSIRRRGLLASKARMKRKAVWVHTSNRTTWACDHMLSKGMGPLDKLVDITVNVPRSWLTRHAKGIWYVNRDIPPGRIVKVEAYTVSKVTV